MTDKTLGDYGVEVDKALASNNTSTMAPIVAEMRAALPPKTTEEAEAEAKALADAPKPPPVDLGMAGFADALDKAALANNVAEARKIAADMIAVEAPSPPPPA